MPNIQTEKIKYGIGITADYTDVALAMRVGEKDSIGMLDGAVVCDVEYKELGIINYGLFAHVLENAKDVFKITISDDTALYPLELNALKDTALAYIRVVVEKDVQVTIHEQVVPKDFIGCIIDVVLKEGSQVTYIADQRAAANTSVLALRRAFVGERAKMKWIDVAIGGAIANSTIYTSLDGRGAVGETYGLFYGKSDQLHDIAHTTIHNAPRTTSKMRTNGALDEKSKAIYRSLIDIREHAVDADGQQKEETLLLSPNAQVSSVPDLEIANNEVVCSHGVATSNVDDESLFYFHSRGMSTQEAKRAIVDGHHGVILDMIEDESIKLRIADTLQKKYE